MEARYLRVKNWGEFQHYRDKEPGWIKLYARIIRGDALFLELAELEQWQLVRIWVAASQSSRFTLDDDERKVPVVPDDEQYLRRATATLRKIPLAKFIREGWLIPVADEELLPPSASSPTLDVAYAVSSSLASAGANGRANAHSITRGLEKERKPKAVTEARYDGQRPGIDIKETTLRALEGGEAA